MERRQFIGRTFAGGALAGSAAGIFGTPAARAAQSKHMVMADNLLIERDQPGKPHQGKVLAAIQPHGDDIPIFAGGLVAKLISEGYKGYLINISNDDHAGPGTVGDTCVANERDWKEIAEVLGLEKVVCLGYRNHQMEDIDIIELKARLIFLFRAWQVDTVIGYDPWGHYEENPDHYMTAQAVEAACWMAGGGKDYPEHFKAGLKPKGVREKYYHARGTQYVNCIVDISSHIDGHIRSNVANKAQGPAGNNGVRLRDRLAKENKRIPALEGGDDRANYEYVRQFLLEDEKALGKQFGFEYAQAYHYIGPKIAQSYTPSLNEYINTNAVPIR